ncbi:branched-chain amino acid ABC transporter permease [Mesorhizobium sp. J428]|uniref:branched-chain amino acid ABC transporter permease n=1 Tax=Mesorhizobium sp. J428 TaxID=2898440 RepID=UPI00215192A9|nr:branched-chain amino acid ABC transporter permease [Mesorhizobium sp. J428]MCR5859932.1 branched-chain amino acid ABC transporter permease [Mesorhizobium sp. J428]
MNLFLEFSLIGIASGGIYVLAALSFVIVYKATNIFNFATGEMMMMGTYFFYLFDTQLGLGWIAGLGAGLCAAALLALVVERSMLRPLLGRPHIVLVMVTFGVGSILRGIAGLVWGPNYGSSPRSCHAGRSSWATSWSRASSPGASSRQASSPGCSCSTTSSRAPAAIRATSTDQVTAESLGINIRAVFLLAWALAGLLTATSGIITASVNGVTPQLGQVALNVLAVVMLAGMTSVGGVVVAGLFVGWMETIVGAYLGAAWQSFIPYLVVLVVMFVKPSGLFGEQRVERI